MRMILAMILTTLLASSALALDITVALKPDNEAAFTFLMDRANAKLVAEKKAPFPSLSAYVSYLLQGYVVMETNGVRAERKAAAMARLVTDPANLSAEDKAILGIK